MKYEMRTDEGYTITVRTIESNGTLTISSAVRTHMVIAVTRRDAQSLIYMLSAFIRNHPDTEREEAEYVKRKERERAAMGCLDCGGLAYHGGRCPAHR